MAMSPEQIGNNPPRNDPSNSPPKENNEIVDDDSGLSVSSSPSSCSSGSDGESPQQSSSSRREIGIARQTIEIKLKSESLANFIIASTLDTNNVNSKDDVEVTLLRCTNAMVSKHEILFNGMMRKLQVTNETAYSAFICVVNQLFEVETEHNTISVTWSRIIALYAFSGQLALYCKRKNLRALEDTIPKFLGRYAKEKLTSYILEQGGWKKICTEFPPEHDFENKVFKILTWTALGLGIATAASFLVSNH